MKYLIILSLLFSLSMIGCSEDDTTNDDSTTGDQTNDDQTTSTESNDDSDDSGDNTGTEYALSGIIQDAKCLQDGDITIQELDDGLIQNGTNFIDKSDENGGYSISATTEKNYVLVRAEISCMREDTGAQMPEKTLMAVISLANGEQNNVNPLTTIALPVSKALYKNAESPTYHNADESITKAQNMVLNYMDMPDITVPFTDMNITVDGDHNSVLIATTSALLLGKTVEEQQDFMGRISDDIIAGTTNHQSEYLTSLRTLPLKTIKENIATIYNGEEITIPPFWNVIDTDGDGIRNENDPDSHVELLERSPILNYIKRSGDSSILWSGNARLKFALPVVFNDSVVNSKYAGLNINGGNISVYTSKYIDGGCPTPSGPVSCYVPDVEIVSIDELKENFIGDTISDENGDDITDLPSKYIGGVDGASLTPGNKYFIIVSNDEAFFLAKNNDNVNSPFGSTLFYSEGCADIPSACVENWVGYYNNDIPGNISFYEVDGFEYFLTD